MVSPMTTGMMQWFKVYWSAFPEREQLDPDELVSLIRLRTKGTDTEQVALTVALAEKLKRPMPADAIHSISSTLHELDFSGRLGAMLMQYNDGQEIDLTFDVLMLAKEVRRSITDGDKPQWADGSILDYLNEDSDEGGIRLNFLKELADSIKGLQPGDNVAVVAPTDKGKTSMLCRIAVESARQGKLLYPGKPFLYLVNEGTAKKIVNRLYQTVTGLSRKAMLELEAANPGELERLYCAAVGSRDAIRVVSVHGKNIAQVARIVEQHSPYAVITDMTGRVRAMSNKGGGMNDIGQLEEVWDGMRELAAIYEFWHLGTVQVSAEGFNMLFPPISAMQNSKTGIQTTLDLCIMMGALISPEMASLRGISTPKNKLARSGATSMQQFQVIFEPETNLWS
jgi:hypothetical protein